MLDDEKTNTPQTGSLEGTPAGTGKDTSSLEAPSGENPPIIIKDEAGNEVKRYTSADELAKAYRESEKAMSAAQKRASESEKELLSYRTREAEVGNAKEAREAEANRLMDEQMSDPIAYREAIIREAEQRAETKLFIQNKPELLARARERFDDFGKYEETMDKLLQNDGGIAKGFKMAYPDKYGDMSLVDIAYTLAKAPEMVRKVLDEKREAEKRISSGIPAASSGKAEMGGEESLSPDERRTAHEMFSKYPPGEAEKMYLKGKKI